MDQKMHTIPEFQKSLLSWFRIHKRELPWRKTKSPYKIWISEILLQQTRVESVIPYYAQFLRQFPSINSLASADLQDVLKCCEGIGYYSRIRNLRKTAKIIEDKYNGRFPDNYADIIELPGIGEYTAAAICSIAFDQSMAAIDGNVLRVIARVFSINEDISKLSVKKKIRSIIKDIIPAVSCGEFNQALMELGALVCLPVHPKCMECPLSFYCAAYKNNTQLILPLRKEKKPVPHYRIGAGLVWKYSKILITRRKEEGFLGGLWELPGGKKKKDESIKQCIFREIMEEVKIEVKVADFFKRVHHAYTHFRITFDVYNCEWIKGIPECTSCIDWRWVEVRQLHSFPFPRANKVIIDKLSKHI
jgi:A/G-specific adenine glycosylase